MISLEVKEKWLEALRSGNYKQGRTALRRQDTNRGGDDLFCCLGVLCDVVAPTEWEPDTGDDIYLYHQYNHGGLPSTALLEDVNLTQVEARQLSRMNDEGKSFLDIADFIEMAF